MTDTPRTDKLLKQWMELEVNKLQFIEGLETLARRLERDLNAETQAFSDYMTKFTIEANDLKHEIGNLRQHIELLREQNRVLGEEIGGKP